jgi:hypothetical protein
MKVDKALRREAQQHKARRGMRVSGRSVFVIEQVLAKKADAAKAATR